MNFKKTNIKFIILIILITALTYANSLKNDFVYDDYWVIIDNKFVQSLKNLPLVFSGKYLTEAKDINFLGVHKDIGSGETTYRPVVTLTYFIDYHLWQFNAFGYHLLNLLLHIFNSILVYFLAASITKKNTIALLASLLFALHPVNSEAVNAISFREDLLCFLFFVSSLLLYIRSDDYNNPKKAFVYISSLILFLLSLFSKEMAISLPIVIILYDYYYGKPAPIINRFKYRYLGYFIASVIYLLIWGLLIGNRNQPFKHIDYSFYAYIFTMSVAVMRYIQWLLIPVGIHATINDPSLVFSAVTWKAVISILLILICVVIGFKAFRRSREISFSIAWFFITLSPVLNIFSLNNIMASRYLYIPVFGFCLLISILLLKLFYAGSLKTGGFMAKYAIAAILIIYSMLTVMRNAVWKDNISLWSEIVRYYPNNASAHSNLGSHFFENNLFDSAINEYSKALRLNPDAAEYYNGLGACYYSKGMLDEAIVEYKKALMLNPKALKVYNNLGLALNQKGMHKEAIECYEGILRMDPQFLPAYNNLAIVYIKMERWEDAKRMLRSAIEIDPHNEKTRNILKEFMP